MQMRERTCIVRANDEKMHQLTVIGQQWKPATARLQRNIAKIQAQHAVLQRHGKRLWTVDRALVRDVHSVPPSRSTQDCCREHGSRNERGATRP
jgi:hypothetical protein